MDRDRVDKHLHGIEALLTDPPPLLSLVILANGSGLMAAHPMFMQGNRERQEAAVRLIRSQLREVTAHFELLAENLIQASVQDRDGVPR